MTQVIRRLAASAVILVALIGFVLGGQVVSGKQLPRAEAFFGFELCASFGAGFTGGWVQGAVGVRGCIGGGGGYRPLVWENNQPYIPYGSQYLDYPQQWGAPMGPMRWAPPCPPQMPPPLPPPPQYPPPYPMPGPYPGPPVYGGPVPEWGPGPGMGGMVPLGNPYR